MKDLYTEGFLVASSPVDIEDFADLVWSIASGFGEFRVAFETPSSDPKWPYGSDYHWFRSHEDVAKRVSGSQVRLGTGGEVGLREEDILSKCHLLFLPPPLRNVGVIALPDLTRLGGEHSWMEWERYSLANRSVVRVGGIYFPQPNKKRFNETISPYCASLVNLVRHLVPLLNPELASCGEMGDTKNIAVRVREGRLWFLNWFNVFGPDYVERYGKDFLLGAPGYLKDEWAGGSVVYQVTKGFAPREAAKPSPTEVESYFASHPKVKRLVYRPWLKKALAFDRSQSRTGAV